MNDGIRTSSWRNPFVPSFLDVHSALKHNIKATVQLHMATAYLAPTYSATLRSNCSVTLPSVNHPESKTSRTAACSSLPIHGLASLSCFNQSCPTVHLAPFTCYPHIKQLPNLFFCGWVCIWKVRFDFAFPHYEVVESAVLFFSVNHEVG